MTYGACASGQQTTFSIEKEGLRIGQRFLDFADFRGVLPLNHRVMIDTLAGERIEVSMLGYSFDGFWEELMNSFSSRSQEALFAEGALLMYTEGEYRTPTELGRGKLALYNDSICILPQTCGARRIPLCFAEKISLTGYQVEIVMHGGARYSVGKMGYDTKPFFERALQASEKVKKERAKLLSQLTPAAPFIQCGLFRTTQPKFSWQAGYGDGVCAVELSVDEDSATYLYRFEEPQAYFSLMLEEAMEAMGPHREIIYLSEEELNKKPLYRMAVVRSEAVRFLRSRSNGRLIHNASHAQRLAEYLKPAKS